MKKTIKIVVNIIAWIIVVIALLMTVMVFTSKAEAGVSNVFGVMPFSVQTDSMKPTFNKGDLIFGSKVDVDTLKKGDIITFFTIINNQREINTHRIVDVKVLEGGAKSFVTKGDNNGSLVDDKNVYQSDVISKYNNIRLPGVGKALDFLKTQTGFFICIILPLAIFFLWCLYQFIGAIILAKRSKLSSEEEEDIKKKAIEEYLSAQENIKDKSSEETEFKSVDK